MSAGAVRAGSAYVEIGADPRKFFGALNRVNKALGSMGRAVAGAGARATAIGVGTLAPFAAAVREGAAYQSTLLNIQASTNMTAAEMDKVKAASMAMSKALSIGPTEAADSLKELVKGGLTLDQVLSGAGTTAAQFAQVAEMAAGDAAVVLSKAMNAFGVGADTAANALSAAADASATSIPEISQAFSQVSAVAASSNQSIEDTAAALAILANKGVVGSDAGTSLKTMLQRLKGPSDEATAALQSVGLSIADLRDESSGKLLALPQLIGTLEKAFANVDETTKDIALKKIFGERLLT
ncbi:phage tail tape measure protein [bacterium]|nr:phage tail tape measure protein [bacterium]